MYYNECQVSVEAYANPKIEVGELHSRSTPFRTLVVSTDMLMRWKYIPAIFLFLFYKLKTSGQSGRNKQDVSLRALVAGACCLHVGMVSSLSKTYKHLDHISSSCSFPLRRDTSLY